MFNTIKNNIKLKQVIFEKKFDKKKNPNLVIQVVII